MAGIDRRKVNKQSVSASDPAKSGFDLSYTSFNDFVLGFAHVGGLHWQMPGSKFGGHNKGDFTFNNVSTPFVTPIDATQYNIAVSLRSIDNSFEDAFAPSKHNDMSNNWHVPVWQLNVMVQNLLQSVSRLIDTPFEDDKWSTEFGHFMSQPNNSNIAAADIAWLKTLLGYWRGTPALPIRVALGNHYLLDGFYDWCDFIESRINGLTISNTYQEARYAIFDGFFTPLFGECSLIDELGFIKLRRYDLQKLSQMTFSAPSDLYAAIDSTEQSEYALRGYYAIWYELIREPNLEPVSPTLPKWKHFGSAPVCDIPFFFHRYRSWYDDPFTTSQPDDMSRHVYAPIFESTDIGVLNDNEGANVQFPASDYDYENAEGNSSSFANQHNIVSQKLTWRDSLTGAQKFINCPIPAMVNDSLRSSNNNFDTLGLDLFNLRQAQSLERYLKRNFYFGDEYKDRMLAHYGSEVSDNRLNRPTLLSTSINCKEDRQEVANVSTGESTVGDRVATMTVKSSGDGYEYFAEEFTIVFNMISFMPRPQYAGVLPHNLLYRETDFPVPEFAPNNEELSRAMEVAVSGLAKTDVQKVTFGHHPYAHIWRSRVDEVHGSFISARRDYTFARFFGADDIDHMPKLNYMFIHCRPNLGMFLNTIRLDGQLYGSVVHEFYSECPLPVPVETI